MKYLTFGPVESKTYPICILVPDLHRDEILKHYITPYGLDPKQVLVLSLHRSPTAKKTLTAEMKAYIAEELVPVFQDYGVEYLIVGDGDYFKTLAGVSTVEAKLGYVLPSPLPDVTQQIVYVPNWRTVFRDPYKVNEKIALGIGALGRWIQGTYADPGVSIIKDARYLTDRLEIKNWLIGLLDTPELSCDIEGFGLKHYNAGLGTITFCWNQHEGIAFPIDYVAEAWTDEAGVNYFGRQVINQEIRGYLREFFKAYRGKIIWHNIAYDAYVLIYQLFMEHILDNEGMLQGMAALLPEGRWHCTKLISYLAVNSCSRNELSLKKQAQEFAGDYAQEEIKDIRKIPLPQLLQYNLVDGLSTWFVFNKNWPRMVADQQLEIYQNLFQPATLDIIQMQLTGMPVDMGQVLEVEDILSIIIDDANQRILANPKAQEYLYLLKEEHVRKRNEKLKTKRITMTDEEVSKVVFNLRSPDQLQGFLFEFLGLPVISYTKTKQPSTGADDLKALLHQTKDPATLEFLSALIDFKAVDKILGTFIEALKGSVRDKDGWHWLYGNFNLGGTVSGRLSSSGPNLQNLPANVVMALSEAIMTRLGKRIKRFLDKGKLLLGKVIKSCFQAPPGWFFCGIDFASLEDRISALTTKDPNKLKVYTDGFDGHAMRSVAYFGHMMPDIDPTSVESVNAIAEKGHKYGSFRQDSKAPTFALTYQGTYRTLMTNCGFDEQMARLIESRYHELYKVSDLWVAEKLNQASRDGYITAAFGLRVRTPMLHQVIRGLSKTPHEAEAEGRTAGNALGQSWCLLNSRAGSEFMGKVRASEFKHAVKPMAQIHDANYMLVKDDIDAIHFANEHIVKACQWQDHPDIWHDEVKLGGEFSIFYPTWAEEVGIPNGATTEEVYGAFEKHVHKLEEKMQKAA